MRPLEPNVILYGGSSERMTHQERIRHLPDCEEKIKLPLGNRVEHFEPTNQVELHDGRTLRVFAWVQNTYVAE
jgi:hypothetical protein